MAITVKEKELVAVGISVASGCKPCTNFHVKSAREVGASRRNAGGRSGRRRRLLEQRWISVPNAKIMPVLTEPGMQTGGGVDDLHLSPAVKWLLNEGWAVSYSSKLVEKLAARLLALGFPLSRLLVSIRSLKQQSMNIRYSWSSVSGHTEIWPAPYIVTD